MYLEANHGWKVTAVVSLLAIGNNERGDLFTRLLRDYFYALGYDECVFDTVRVGREVDVRGHHRVEARSLRAEAKAHSKPIGGADINKFFGVLDAERRSTPDPITGYFVSLSGFTGTAIQQELEVGQARVILVDGDGIESELARSTVIVSRERAIERAARCAAAIDPSIRIDGQPKLVAHQIGWLWAVKFSSFKKETHVCFIHADGEPLDVDVARIVQETDALLDGEFHNLEYLGPRLDHPHSGLIELETDYRSRVSAAYGVITLEGMPADETVGSRPLRLESIYVPTSLVPLSSPTLAQSEVKREPIFEGEREGVPASEVLSSCRQVAILGMPGSGKSTFVKRLATRYASQTDQNVVNDGLPARDWLPFVIRCRQVAATGDATIVNELRGIAESLEMTSQPELFAALVHQALTDGRALLLVDGLDELPDEAFRVRFAQQLRIFMSTYPAVSVVMTSREAGFRSVAPAIASACDIYRVADLGRAEISQLTLAWHREVVGDSGEVRAGATELATAIWDTDRVRLLATNPLLLTTLLLVQRWVGSLPRRRTVLYDKAIEVLLMTWNVEGHAPVEREEALPQLGYLAFEMMRNGEKSISSSRLSSIFTDARLAMPDILGFAKVSVPNLISRIEDRSSLLVQSGHVVDGGVLQPLYEFKHLTFQEYLAATAVVSGYFENGRGGVSPEEVLEPFLGLGTWREVIPLAAVLAGRRAEGLVQRLSALALEHTDKSDGAMDEASYSGSLAQSLIDEALVTPSVAREAMDVLIQTWGQRNTQSTAKQLLSGKYGDLYEEALRDHPVNSDVDLSNYVSATSDYVSARYIPDGTSGWDTAVRLLTSEDPFDILCGALAVMLSSYHIAPGPFSGRGSRQRKVKITRQMRVAVSNTVDLLDSSTVELQYAACWSLAWCSLGGLLDTTNRPLVGKVFKLWRKAEGPNMQRMAAWAFWTLPAEPQHSRPLGSSRGHVRFIRAQLDLPSSESKYFGDHRKAALTAAAYLGDVIPRDGILEMAVTEHRHQTLYDRFLSRNLTRILGSDAVEKDALD